MDATTPARGMGTNKDIAEGWIFLFIAVGAAFLWFCLTLFQIVTTEAWYLKTDAPAVGQTWAAFVQLQMMAQGQLSGEQGKAIVIGWGSEMLTLMLGLALEFVLHVAGKGGKKLREIFLALSLLALAVNFWTDSQYGSSAQGAWGQIFFAAVMAIVVIYFLPLSIEALLRAKKAFGK